MSFVYVLKLKDEHWYVGKTETSKFRIDTHFDSDGSAFTKKYPPEEIYQIIPECDKFDEDKYVKKYMDKYGIDNVRGGSYSRLELSDEERKHIQKELWGANDLCFMCGGDHFVKDCPNNNQVEESCEKETISNEDDERTKWIKYYENQLFELEHGCWELLGFETSLDRILHSKQDLREDEFGLVCGFHRKIFSKHNAFKIDMKNIKEISKYVICGNSKVLVENYTNDVSGHRLVVSIKTNKFKLNAWGTQTEYDIVQYEFKTTDKIFKEEDSNSRRSLNDLGYNHQIRTINIKKNELEYKLYTLKNEKSEKEEAKLKLSTTLTDKINANKQRFEDNFTKILCILDETMHNIPETVIAQGEYFSPCQPQSCLILPDEHKNWHGHGGCSGNRPICGEEYKPTKLLAIEFKVDTSLGTLKLVCCYEVPAINESGYKTARLYTKLKNTVDIVIKPMDSVQICSRLNELGFNTLWTDNHQRGSQTFNECGSFMVTF